MYSSNPDLFRRPRSMARRRRRALWLRILLPVAAALPLVFTVVRHWPARKVEPIREARAGDAEPVAQENDFPEAELPRTHQVKAGDTLSEIAEFYGCSVSALAAVNGMDPHGRLLIGTRLRLPSRGEGIVAADASASRDREPVLTPAADRWTRGARELEALAIQAPGAQVRSPNYPYVMRPADPVAEEAPPGPVGPVPDLAESGIVPGAVQPVSGLTMMTGPETTIQYLVQPGDEFERVAAAHFTTVAHLKRLNRVESLAPGQVIEIPVDQCLTARP
jgi:LysM repeat protein